MTRCFNQVSDLGKFLDPLAGFALYLAAGMAVCSILDYIPIRKSLDSGDWYPPAN